MGSAATGLIWAALRPCQRRIFWLYFLSTGITAHSPKLYQGSLGMWSNLLVAFLMFMPAFMYGTVLWLNYLQ
jgi:hypothetical protein